MATCGSLQHIFENPLNENSTLLESLSQWNQLKPVKPLEQSSITEIFGELHFKENKHSSSSFSFPISSFSSPSLSSIASSPQSETTQLSGNDISKYENGTTSLLILKNQYTSRRENGGRLQLCTEGLGFESSDDVEDSKTEMDRECQHQQKKVIIERHSMSANISRESRRSISCGRAIPPPISCIGKSGRPGVCFQSYRQDGRFVLREVRIPTQELLHACREDGRLKLQFIQPNDDEAEYEECEENNFTEDGEEEETEETAEDYYDDDSHRDDANSRDDEN